MDNSQAVLDSDDEMDDIINEFAETENDIVELSDESSADEMDSLLDEFANNQSDSDADEKKFDPQIVLSSDDDEMENILEEFREENVLDTPSQIKTENDLACSVKTENKSVVFDTDNRNGTIFNNTFEILFSEDSGDKSSDENVFNSTAKKSLVSSPKLLEFKICKNFKQEQLDENEKCDFPHDIEKLNSKSVLDSETATSSEAISINQSCKKECNVDIREEENVSQNEPLLNSDANLCKNSEISINSPINNMTNFDTVNLCEKNTTYLSQEDEPPFSIKISSVSSVQNSEDSEEAVIEGSEQNLGLEDNAGNTSHLSAFEKEVDESNLSNIKSLIQGLEDSATNTEEISPPFANESNSTMENMDLCQINEEITQFQKISNDEVSCNGKPNSREESRKRWTKIRNSLRKTFNSKKMKSDQEHSEPQLKSLNPITSSNHPTCINFSRKEDMFLVPRGNFTPTTLATPSVPCQVNKRMLEPSEASIILKDYLDYKTKPVDHLTKYFQSVEETVRTFPIHLQIEAKKQISEIMSHLELKSFYLTNQNVHPALRQYSQHPPPHPPPPPPPYKVEHSNKPFFQSCEFYSYSGMDYSTPPNV